jgi:hypothetical protein
MANSIATAYVDLKIDTKGLQQGLNQVKGQLTGSTAAMSGMTAATLASGVGMAAAAGTMAASSAKLAKGLSDAAGASKNLTPIDLALKKIAKDGELGAKALAKIASVAKTNLSIPGMTQEQANTPIKGYAEPFTIIQKEAHKARIVVKKLNSTLSVTPAVVNRTSAAFASLAKSIKAAWLEIAGFLLALRYVFQARAEVENLTNRFISMGYSVETAKKHMEDLQEYTNRTRFNLPSVSQASAILLRFTNGAMGGVDALQKIGDAADIADKPIEDVALYVGKLYAALAAGGVGAGESLRVLRDMGVVSADAIVKIQGLLLQGGKGAEIIATLMDDFTKSAGTSKRSATSLGGKLSTLKDSFKGLGATIGKIFSPAIKGLISSLSFLATLLAKTLKLMDTFITKYSPIPGLLTLFGANDVGAISEVGQGTEFRPSKMISEEFIEKEKTALEQLAKLRKSYQDKLLSFNMRRMSDEEKIATLIQSKGQYELIAHGYAVASAEELYAAGEKLLDIDQQIAELEENSAKRTENAMASYKQKLSDFFSSRTDNVNKILILELEIAKQMAIASNEASKSEEERYKAKEKLLDLDQKILAIQREEVNTFRSAQTSMAALRDKVAQEQADSSKGLGFTGKFVGGEEAVKFSQQVQHDSIKAAEDHNKKMEEYQKEQIKIQTDYAKRGGETVEGIKKLYDLIKGGDMELGVALL